MRDPDPKRTAKPDVVCSGCLARNRPCSCKTESQIFRVICFATFALAVTSLLTCGVVSVVRHYLALN